MKKFENNTVVPVRIRNRTQNIKIQTARRMAEDTLKPIFVNHIGVKNKISASDLFKKVYGFSFEEAKTKKYILKKALDAGRRYCKNKTGCTIIPEYDRFGETPGTYYYFVASSVEEAKGYQNFLGKITKGFNKSGKNVMTSVKKGNFRNPAEW